MGVTSSKVQSKFRIREGERRRMADIVESQSVLSNYVTSDAMNNLTQPHENFFFCFRVCCNLLYTLQLQLHHTVTPLQYYKYTCVCIYIIIYTNMYI